MMASTGAWGPASRSRGWAWVSLDHMSGTRIIPYNATARLKRPDAAALRAYMPPMQNPSTATWSAPVASAAAAASASTASSASDPTCSSRSAVERCSRPGQGSKAHTGHPVASDNRATCPSIKGRNPMMSGMITRPRDADAASVPTSGTTSSAGVFAARVTRTSGCLAPRGATWVEMRTLRG